ncbi:MAG TPA: SMC-Scp complex subunit ScpB [Candidatus Lokiarchaeia archaeon]|nr:SMC-Scp complex subunit ScpB [Candidatus Lokiarchaeia archaeon]
MQVPEPASISLPPSLNLDLTLTESDAIQCIEAQLFATTRELTLEEIAGGVGLPDLDYVRILIGKLMLLYKSRGGALMVRETLSGAYIMSPRDEVMPFVEDFTQGDLLDIAELRTLALIAYEQPMAKKDLKKRRSGSAPHVKKLAKLGFITIETRDGKDEWLSTTSKFADYFNLSPDPVDIKELLGVFLVVPETEE